MKWSWMNKKEKPEIQLTESEVLAKLHICEGRLRATELSLEREASDSKRLAKESYDEGNTYQFNRYAQAFGKTKKAVELVKSQSALVGGVRDALRIASTTKTVIEVGKIVDPIGKTLNIDTKSLSTACEKIAELSENVKIKAEEYAKVADSLVIGLSETEFSEVKEKLAAEFESAKQAEELDEKEISKELKEVKETE